MGVFTRRNRVRPEGGEWRAAGDSYETLTGAAADMGDDAQHQLVAYRVDFALASAPDQAAAYFWTYVARSPEGTWQARVHCQYFDDESGPGYLTGYDLTGDRAPCCDPDSADACARALAERILAAGPGFTGIFAWDGDDT